MCFFKHLPSVQTVRGAMDTPRKLLPETYASQSSTESELFALPQKQEIESGKVNSNLIWLNCFSLINFNSQILMAMDQKLSLAQHILDSGREILSEEAVSNESVCKRQSSTQGMPVDAEEENLFPTCDALTVKIFGSASYKYRLVLEGDFLPTLYKERNFACSVRLVDRQGKEINNGNIVNVCLGLCDDNGEWIHQTKEGQGFIKGKIESQLYHGTAGFVKMAARDVSRGFINKTVNVVIYPKPTVLKYSGESSIEEHIDYSLIEPLVIHGVSIMAKKRE